MKETVTKKCSKDVQKVLIIEAFARTPFKNQAKASFITHSFFLFGIRNRIL